MVGRANMAWMQAYSREVLAERHHKLFKLDDFLQDSDLMKNLTGEAAESRAHKWHDNFKRSSDLHHFSSPQQFLMARVGHSIHLRVHDRLTEIQSWNNLLCILEDAPAYGFPFAVIADQLKRQQLATNHDNGQFSLTEQDWAKMNAAPEDAVFLPYTDKFKAEVRSLLSPTEAMASLSTSTRPLLLHPLPGRERRRRKLGSTSS